MIYELMNRKELKEKCISVICGLELADEFVADVIDSEEEFFYEYTEEEIEDILNENEFFICSRNVYEDGEVEYFIEPLLHENGEQYNLDSDVVIVEDDLVDIVEFDKLGNGEVLTLRIEECEESDELDETDTIIEEMTDDLLNSLEKEENCPHCEIKNMLTTLWNIAYESGWDEASEFIKEEVSNVFKK
uniref:Uncharacterized protein n=1 Tax=virus sp. ctE0n6 TaxID=2827985 RepID=A0A8S5RFU9_9VIRU|nr:MAG TPA: hypothetical protein [virus sp. ctE0n6]